MADLPDTMQMKMEVSSDLGNVLRDRGYRLTSARWLVWSVLRSAHGHLTAEEVAESVNEADPSINISSIYRSLALFEELDLAREAHLGIDDSARWEIAHPDDHFHMVCRKCGSVDHHVGELVDQIRSHLTEHHSFQVENVDLVVTGVCENCL
ncbi:MAG TPA: Fur family transcriptional regulator [Acidimicrobiia bacterium]|nr:Fur family transcriptional regulator [Acidimicrobiia bacterium]